ncbi:hypothetical protein RN001_002019 [Aquatica leii]|uniref:Uncharacterized protein n=1 Tax=Aquatica leii TaxID=1421715 RepID=A0AAN7SR35_9COLE|nr:hypothetical protein RN001_002019 [Aquatica leii]
MPETRQASRMELNDDERIEKTIEKVLNNQSFIKRIVETATAVIRELYEERIKALEAKCNLLLNCFAEVLALPIMSGKIEEGFVRAQSDNLPEVNNFMVAEYFANNDCYSALELCEVKEDRAARANYGMSAVFFLKSKQLKTLKQQLRKPDQPLQQVVNRISEHDYF